MKTLQEAGFKVQTLDQPVENKYQFSNSHPSGYQQDELNGATKHQFNQGKHLKYYDSSQVFSIYLKGIGFGSKIGLTDFCKTREDICSNPNGQEDPMLIDWVKSHMIERPFDPNGPILIRKQISWDHDSSSSGAANLVDNILGAFKVFKNKQNNKKESVFSTEKKENGFFIEVGANDGVHSNTIQLEVLRHWTGKIFSKC